MEKTENKELDTLKAEIANLREDVTKIFGDLKKYAEAKVAHGISTEKEQVANCIEKSHQLLNDLINKLDSTKTRGKKVVKETITRVEDHPLITIMISLGLGYLMSKICTDNANDENTCDSK
jgi:ElaB/YqjD/DUF883 family membrane-anchored ribosome-binding protein